MNSNGWVFRLGLVMPLVMAFLLIINSFISSDDAIRVQGSQIEVFEDASASMDIEAISKLESENFKTLQGNAVPNFGFSRSNIWIRFTLDGNQFTDDSFILEVKNPVLDRIDLYEFHSTEYKLINETGDLLEHSSRQINHRNFRFDIRLSEQEQKVYYLMVNSGGEQLYVPLILHSKSKVAVIDLKDQIIIGSYFGIIIFVILFNLFLYLIIQERSHIYYVLYNFNLLLLQVSLTGFGFQFLWPDSPYLANVTNPFFASVAVFSLLKFSQYFLQLKKFFPKVNRVFQITGGIILVNAVISLFNVQPLLYVAIVAVNVLTLLLNVAIILVAIGVVRKGFGPAKFFLAAFIILVLTVFGFILTNLGVIQSDFFASNGLLIGSAMEVVLLSFAIVDKFRNYKDDALNNLRALNKLQIEQNVVLERKVEERTREIFEQQQEILSSIRYAERIQRNILPNEAAMQSLFPKSFVYYLPKDIISGDFYWINENRDSTNEQNILRFATGDCTGHGVPGAMMSILGYNLIREALEHFPKGSSAQLLEEMDRLLKSALNSGAYAYASDGMDIVICQIDLDKDILNMSGANLGVIVYREGALIDLKGTRRPLGLIDEKLLKPFEDIQFDLQKGDIIYTFTDGYVDQFGGGDQKKLKQKGLKELILQIADLPLNEQKEALHQFHLNWRGELEQVDDICIMAIQYGV
jgi:serine phosphatase RsbU (regulator of sigma subunit)